MTWPPRMPHQSGRIAGSTSGGWAWNFRVQLGEIPDAARSAVSSSAVCRSPKLARVEAALLIAGGPVTVRRLVQVATLADTGEAHALIEQLNAAYDAQHTAFRVERVATGFQLLTRPVFAHWLSRLHQRQAELKLSAAALETLTILAYRQPMTRADLEAVRGVQCTDLLKMLMDRGLVRIAGEDESLGRPFLYETTRKFLETYGLRSLDDLPSAEVLRLPRPSQAGAAEADAA